MCTHFGDTFRFVWPLSTAVEALTSDSPHVQAESLKASHSTLYRRYISASTRRLGLNILGLFNK